MLYRYLGAPHGWFGLKEADGALLICACLLREKDATQREIERDGLGVW